MAKQNRSKLKTHFQTGDVPNQSEYSHLIDSQLNLEDTEIQTIKGGIDCDGGVTGSGVLKGSGLHVTSQASELGGTLAVTGTTSLNNNTLIQGNLNVSASNGHITASGGITSSGQLIANSAIIDATLTTKTGDINALTGNLVTATGNVLANNGYVSTLNVTASSNISASGHISASEFVGKISASNVVMPFTDLTLTGNISASGTISASGMFVNGAGTASFGTLGEGHVEIRNNSIFGFETDDPDKFGYQLLTSNQQGKLRLYNSNNTLDRILIQANGSSTFNAAGVSVAGMHIGSNTDGERMGTTGVGADGPRSDDGFHRKLNVFGGIMTTGSFDHASDGDGRVTLHNGHVTASGNLQVHGAQVDFTNLPTSDPSTAGRLFTQTATELGGSGTTKVICVSAG